MKPTLVADAIPDPPNDEVLYEFVDGEWIDKEVSRRGPPRDFCEHLEKEPKSLAVSLVACCLFAKLHRHFDEPNARGTVAFDAWFFADDERKLLTRLDIAVWLADPLAPQYHPKSKVRFAVAPDIAVEIIGEFDTVGVVGNRERLFFDRGVKEVWQVYSATRTIYIYSRGDSNIRVARENGLHASLTSDLLPGFAVRVGDLFPKA